MSKTEALRAAAQQALEALVHHTEQTRPIWRTADAIAALRAALAAPAVPPGWQPIETAPEREWVLLAIEGRWVTTGDKWPGFGWQWEETDDEPEDARPTHWHPIPAAPTAQQEPARAEGE